MIPFFDGHNDSLERTLDFYPGDTAVDAFANGNPHTHIDLPRAKRAGMVGGFFAIFPSSKSVSVIEQEDDALPPALETTQAQQSTNAMAALLMRLEKRDAVRICRSARDVRLAIEARKLAAIFHIEGAECIDREFASFDVYYEAGLRSVGLTWSRANMFGTGVPFLHGADPDIGPGLTSEGKDLVRLCNRRGVLVDLSHLNAAGFRDVAAISTKPLVATHSNVHAICPSTRNLTDWQLAAIRDSRGLVGVNYAPSFLRPDGMFDSDTPLETIVRHIDALIEALGEDGVALGSDFDGTDLPNAIGDVGGSQRLLAMLVEKGYGAPLVRKIALDNWLSMIERTIG